MQAAAANGHYEIVKYLITVGGADITARQFGAFRASAAHGHEECCKYLLSMGCDPRAAQDYAFKSALRGGHTEIAFLIFDAIRSQAADKNVGADLIELCGRQGYSRLLRAMLQI
jgi:ankyrin repeat protein